MEEEIISTFKDCICHGTIEGQVRSILNKVAQAKLYDNKNEEFMAVRERAVQTLMEMIH